MADQAKYKYSDIKVNCNDDEESETGWIALSDAIVILDGAGNFAQKLVYLPGYIAEGLSEEFGRTVAKGWYDELDDGFENCINNETIQFGHAVQVAVEGVDAEATFAGEVKKTATITDVAGFMGIANCAPVELKAGAVKVNCNDEEESETGWIALSDAIIILDQDGNFEQKLVYLPGYIAEGLSEELGCTVVKGWYDELDDGFENCLNNSQAWPISGGFQVAVEGVDATIQIDSAL